jgi:LuxR family transcriptional regulator, maltose regulon positive regulatory protein
MVDAPLVDDDVAAGQAALSRGAWQQARARFETAVASDAAPEALEGLSWATWWLEDVEACIDARERAYHRYRDAGDARGAARMALWLGDDHVEFRSAHAVAGGWFARAARILDDLESCPEHGWLAVFEAHDALGRQDLETARRLAEQARDRGRRHGALDLEMFAVATEGVVRVEQGEITEGSRCLDEAAAAALSGEYENLAAAAWACCLVMATCERVRDYDRAAQWCQQIEAFSRRMDARFLRGVCRAHYGVIRAWQGSWDVADQELVEALRELTTNRPSWRSEALVRLGQLRRMQGRHAEAEELFGQAAEHPLALHGMAAVSLDRGDPANARDLLERALRQIPSESRASRADAIELLLRAHVALGDPASAEQRLDELRSVASEVGTDAMRATASLCDGLLAAAVGDHGRASDRFEDAIDLFLGARAPVEAARARVELGRSLVELDRPVAAAREARLALGGLTGIDAPVERDHAETLLERIGVAEEASTRRDRVLTGRQVEVLRLVAEGLSDQQIADRLVLSPHTVHRHVANIYLRLGCSSRPAAVAEAGRLGLL